MGRMPTEIANRAEALRVEIEAARRGPGALGVVQRDRIIGEIAEMMRDISRDLDILAETVSDK